MRLRYFELVKSTQPPFIVWQFCKPCFPSLKHNLVGQIKINYGMFRPTMLIILKSEWLFLKMDYFRLLHIVIAIQSKVFRKILNYIQHSLFANNLVTKQAINHVDLDQSLIPHDNELNFVIHFIQMIHANSNLPPKKLNNFT